MSNLPEKLLKDMKRLDHVHDKENVMHGCFNYYYSEEEFDYLQGLLARDFTKGIQRVKTKMMEERAATPVEGTYPIQHCFYDRFEFKHFISLIEMNLAECKAFEEGTYQD